MPQLPGYSRRAENVHISPAALNRVTVGTRGRGFTHTISRLWVVFLNTGPTTSSSNSCSPARTSPHLRSKPLKKKGRPRLASFLFFFSYLWHTSPADRPSIVWALLLRSHRGDIIRRWRLTGSTAIFHGIPFPMECQQPPQPPPRHPNFNHVLHVYTELSSHTGALKQLCVAFLNHFFNDYWVATLLMDLFIVTDSPCLPNISHTKSASSLVVKASLARWCM